MVLFGIVQHLLDQCVFKLSISVESLCLFLLRLALASSRWTMSRKGVWLQINSIIPDGTSDEKLLEQPDGVGPRHSGN